MNFGYLKILAIGLVLAFATQGCAVWVRDRGGGGHHRYRHYDHGDRWKHHSSLQQSPQSMPQLARSEDSGGQGQVVR